MNLVNWKYKGKEYKLSQRLFISVPLTGVCNASCPFCINKYNKIPKLEKSKLFQSLDNLLGQIPVEENFIPTVSITGGEPTLHPDVLTEILKIANKNNVRTFLITNGSGLFKMVDSGNRLLEEMLQNNPFLINISRVHYDFEINNRIMKSKSLMNDEELREVFEICNNGQTKIRISTTLLKEAVGTLGEVIKYCDWAVGLGCKEIVFRDLQNPQGLKCSESYIEKNFVSMDSIWDELEKVEAQFEKIDNEKKYFDSKVYRYKGAQVRFQKFTHEEIDDNIVRELIVFPDGTL